MYKFKKLNNEEILLISDNTILKRDNKEYVILTIVTSQRLILLDYPEKTNNYEEALRTSRGIKYIIQKEPILTVGLNDVESIVEESGFNKYMLKDTNYFYIKDKDVMTKIKELL